jgi:hypothetical protein
MPCQSVYPEYTPILGFLYSCTALVYRFVQAARDLQVVATGPDQAMCMCVCVWGRGRAPEGNMTVYLSRQKYQKLEKKDLDK